MKLDAAQMKVAVQFLKALNHVYQLGGTATIETEMVDGIKLVAEVRRVLPVERALIGDFKPKRKVRRKPRP